MEKIFQAKHIYLIGIKGVGMTALAQILKKQGYDVSGSDTAEVFFTDQVLKHEKIEFFSGFSVNNLKNNVDLVIHSSAYNEENNVEMKEVYRKNITTLDLAQAVGKIFNAHKKGIAVCGTHGKSTTSALLSFILKKQGFDPSAIIGSAVPQLKGNALVGLTDLMVIEADEYNNKLKYYQPQGVVLNNIEYDHPDFFKTFVNYQKVFKDFVQKVPERGFVVANFDDGNVRQICDNLQAKVLSYTLVKDNAIDNQALFAIKQEKMVRGYQHFTLYKKNKNLGEFKMKLIGVHNVQNATAVIITCLELKVPIAGIEESLAKFTGLARRMEILGKYQGALFIDDYAHHPTEIKATLSAIRLRYPRQKIICVFMPHTYTRTQALLDDFAKSFTSADEVVVLPIYASAREQRGSISGQDLADKILHNETLRHPNVKVCYVSSLIAGANYLKKHIHKDDMVVLMGAGDSFRIWDYMN